MARLELGPSRNPTEVNFTNTVLTAMDEIYAALDGPGITNFNA